ncbi:CDP-diacylglycerol--serine O-phosphatidyltransferase [Prevotella sp. E13-27]|uniref:CDP-diacylglycerol--serine O-phosphatidyltransferase n=1 Tax=Prevotella sp. E13-27 TaxID=2938122 RepID=UPI00200AC496|nr:CDP-diacylglycerol--serine O-phosphatidyltransferase [Prevotella sp. E13-27]MCK8622222.1 CDP-diacylglycerol--serine O-phosphatidyltransferase [Prevotella sp. E13-27]
MKKHIPNTITCCNLVSGCIATVEAIYGNPTLALLWIITGAVFDFFDGMSARLLGVSSPIGKELDSLADVVTFGVAPSAIIFNYLCGFHQHLLFVPFLAFIVAAFSGLRLAKFNLDERQTTSFIGLPTPANALFWGALIVWMTEHQLNEPLYMYIVLAMIPFSSYLLIAELPLFALKFKHWGWKGNEVKYGFVISAVLLIVCPLVLGYGVIGISAVIAWYVLLSALTNK